MMTNWKTLPWLPDYDISECGQVRRNKPSRTTRGGKVLGQTTTGRYRRVKLAVDGQYRFLSVHRLVCEAFHGPPPSEKHQAAHGDGNRLNNHASNLRWATNRENQRDRIAHGTDPSGERGPNARLTWPQVRAIRARHDGTWRTAAAMAAEYGQTTENIWRICKCETWVKDPLHLPIVGRAA